MFITFTRATILATFITSMKLSATASAHAHLESQSPAAGVKVLTSPQTLTLNFSEGTEPNFSVVALTDSRAARVATGKVKRNEKDEKQLIVPINGNASNWLNLMYNAAF